MSVGVLMAISSVEQEMDLVVSNFGFPIMVVFVQNIRIGTGGNTS